MGLNTKFFIAIIASLFFGLIASSVFDPISHYFKISVEGISNELDCVVTLHSSVDFSVEIKVDYLESYRNFFNDPNEFLKLYLLQSLEAKSYEKIVKYTSQNETVIMMSLRGTNQKLVLKKVSYGSSEQQTVLLQRIGKLEQRVDTLYRIMPFINQKLNPISSVAEDNDQNYLKWTIYKKKEHAVSKKLRLDMGRVINSNRLVFTRPSIYWPCKSSSDVWPNMRMYMNVSLSKDGSQIDSNMTFTIEPNKPMSQSCSDYGNQYSSTSAHCGLRYCYPSNTPVRASFALFEFQYVTVSYYIDLRTITIDTLCSGASTNNNEYCITNTLFYFTQGFGTYDFSVDALQ